MNNKSEKYIAWMPENIQFTIPLSLKRVENTEEGFNIILYEKNNIQKKIFLIFNAWSNAHHVYEEPELIKDRKIKVNNNPFPFFMVQNSAYLKWLHQESYEVWETDKWVHLVILLDDAVIDVCCWDLPIIKYEEQI